MNIDFSRVNFAKPKRLINLSLRFVILIAIILYYLNYRNNQCIKSQNCKPFFITHEIKFYKKYDFLKLVYYKFEKKLRGVDVYFDKEFNDKINQKIFVANSEDEKASNINALTQFPLIPVFDDFDIVNNNSMLIKKIKIVNITNEFVKVKTKVGIEPAVGNDIKIYNCFCNDVINLNPYENRDFYLYLSVGSDKKNVISKITISTF